MAFVLSATAGAAHAGELGVLYPEIREPYRTVFSEIVRGIEQGSSADAVEYEVPSNHAPEDIRDWASAHELDTVIALGSRGLAAAKDLPEGTKVVVGAVLLEPDPRLNGIAAITLTPDPYVLFERLRQLAPRVRRVVVVYNPERTQWLIERAKQAARAKGLRLTGLEARDLRDAAAVYKDMLNGGVDAADAIWILQDSTTIDEGAILSTILREAWDKNIVVFSSNPAHVRRGALFSLYPDNFGMGKSLAELAKAAQSTRFTPQIVPLQDLLIAVNIRTAEHLGLSLSGRESRQFDLVFPAP